MKKFNNEIICGYPIVKVKKILKNSEDSLISLESILRTIQNLEKSQELLHNLLNHGYIETTEEPNKFMLSLRGVALINTRINRLLTPQVAEKKKKEFLSRVEIVNTSDKHLFFVDQVKLLNSYFQDKDLISDLRFDIKLSTKHEDAKTRIFLENQKRRNSRKHFSNLVQELYYPQLAISDFLKGGVHNIIVTLDEHYDRENGEIIFLRQKSK